MRSALVALSLLLAGPAVASEIMVMDPYARAARPGAPTGAVFMMLHNMGETDDRLVSAQSPVAQRVELHTHIMDGDIMKMRKVEGGIPVPAGGMHELGRGGDHVMLMGVTEDLIDGETISITLTFEVSGEVTIEVPVDNARGQGTKGHKHSHDH